MSALLESAKAEASGEGAVNYLHPWTPPENQRQYDAILHAIANRVSSG